ncbi:MAG: hypothetical protein ACR2OZ_18120 [Verrucomicrobiales bacterium]
MISSSLKNTFDFRTAALWLVAAALPIDCFDCSAADEIPVPAPADFQGCGVVMTLQKHLNVSDYYSGLSIMRRASLDGRWQGPTAVPELEWRQQPDGVTISVADVTPGWHAPSGKLLAIGCEVPYDKNGRQLDGREGGPAKSPPGDSVEPDQRHQKVGRDSVEPDRPHSSQLDPASLHPAKGSDAASFHPPTLRLATFSADVTVPIGHGMMGGSWLSKKIADPLEAHGFVITGAEAPIVFVAVDWCEIRNDAYARWQSALAIAAGTAADRVLVTAVHQHDAPIADLEAERQLRKRKLAGTICDLDFHERAVQTVAKALRESLSSAQPLTHLGTGQDKVEKVASNRRYTLPDGTVRFDRTSSTKNRFAIEADEGLIDPWLRTLSFWNRDTPLAAVSFYAVHPMSHYGAGEVSADFPGVARRRRQSETPGVKQIYCCGCSGNITAGKYNTGAPENRAVLAARLHAAMAGAWKNTQRRAIEHFEFRASPLRLEPRTGHGFTLSELEARLTPETEPFQQCLAALALSWRKRVDAGHSIQVPVLDFGVAKLLLLPGESYVEFQLAAQRLRPEAFVCVAGYGDGATGYVPTEKHVAEGDPNLHDWCWVAPGSEERLLRVIREALEAPANSTPAR